MYDLKFVKGTNIACIFIYMLNIIWIDYVNWINFSILHNILYIDNQFNIYIQAIMLNTKII